MKLNAKNLIENKKEKTFCISKASIFNPALEDIREITEFVLSGQTILDIDKAIYYFAKSTINYEISQWPELPTEERKRFELKARLADNEGGNYFYDLVSY